MSKVKKTQWRMMCDGETFIAKESPDSDCWGCAFCPHGRPGQCMLPEQEKEKYLCFASHRQDGKWIIWKKRHSR